MPRSSRVTFSLLLLSAMVGLESCDSLPVIESTSPSGDYSGLPSFELQDPGLGLDGPASLPPPNPELADSRLLDSRPLDSQHIEGSPATRRSSVRVERVGSEHSSSAQVTPLIDPDASSSPAIRPARPLREQQQDLALELGAFLDREQWRLSEDLTVQRLLVRLISLHHLGVDEEFQYRDPILQAFVRVEQPSTRLKHLMAAYYHELGAEEQSARLFPSTTTRRQVDRDGPTISDLVLLEVLRDGKSTATRSRGGDENEYSLRRGDRLTLGVELRHFSTRRVGRIWRSEFNLNIRLLTSDGSEIENISLTRTPVVGEHQSATPKLLKFRAPPYQLPGRLLPGKYEIELRILDLVNAGVSTVTYPVEIP